MSEAAIAERRNEILQLKREIAAKQSRLQKHPQLKDYLIDANTLISPRARQRWQQEKAMRQARFAAFRQIAKKRRWEQTLLQNAKNTDDCDRIAIDGNRYSVSASGAKLVPIFGSQLKEGKSLSWNGNTYVVCKSGVLKRAVGNAPPEHCRYFSRSGVCGRGIHCRYRHDMSRVPLCRLFLAGRCQTACVLSHTATQFNTPICWYKFGDRCTNTACRYSHQLPAHAKKANTTTWTCRPFSVGGWCGRGASCPFAHLYNCPDYEENASCPRGGSCTLTHTASKHVQAKMTSNTVEGVFVTPDVETTVVSSYTVEPEQLFVSPLDEFVVCENGEFPESGNSGFAGGSGSHFVIDWSDSDDMS